MDAPTKPLPPTPRISDFSSDSDEGRASTELDYPLWQRVSAVQANVL